MSDFVINYIHAIIDFTVLKYSTRVCDIVTRASIMSTRIYPHTCAQTQSYILIPQIHFAWPRWEVGIPCALSSVFNSTKSNWA